MRLVLPEGVSLVAVSNQRSEESIKAAFENARRSQRYWEEHWNVFQRKFPNEFVAVRNGELVQHHRDLIALEAALKQAGITIAETEVRFVNDERQPMH
jgi:hypothetical protein